MSLHVTQSWPENGGSFKNHCRWFCIWQQKMGTRPCVLWIVLSVMDLVSYIYRDILLFSLVVGEGGGYLLNDIPPTSALWWMYPRLCNPLPPESPRASPQVFHCHFHRRVQYVWILDGTTSFLHCALSSPLNQLVGTLVLPAAFIICSWFCDRC